ITHSAKSRDGFALGAVMAAEWIASRKGIYTIDQMMDDIL
ncbi:dihydrodipicolinate reductase C-terminal domain-containing protein, partial [uncultured Duncaniella sp.]